MRKIKESVFVVVLLMLVLIISACGAEGVDKDSDPTVADASEDEEEVAEVDEDAEYVIKAAQMMTKDDVTVIGTDKFAELVDEKSDGRIRIQWHYGSQLGSDIETFEAMKNGNLDMAAGSVANLTTITTAFDPFMLPFLFESEEQTLNAIGSEKVHELMAEELEPNNLKWISSYDYGGPRVLGTSKEINSTDDLKSKKIRASRSVMEIAAYESWGAKGITVDWPETPEALRSGMVDGLGDTYASIHSGNLYQGGIVNNIVDIPFQWYFMIIAMDDSVWNELPEDLQEVMIEAARESEQYYAEEKADFVNENIAEMKEEGLKVTTVPDEELDELIDVTKDEVWPKFIGESFTQDTLDLIIEEAGPVEEQGDWGYSVDSK